MTKFLVLVLLLLFEIFFLKLLLQIMWLNISQAFVDEIFRTFDGDDSGRIDFKVRWIGGEEGEIDIVTIGGEIDILKIGGERRKLSQSIAETLPNKQLFQGLAD